MATSEANRKPAGGKLNVALWIIQGLLALLFLFAGGVKLIVPIAAMAKQTGLPGGFLRFIAVCEVLGALGLVLPGITRIRTGLTSLAASGLVIIMIGATWISVVRVSIRSALFPLAVGLLAAFVAYARSRLAPLRQAARDAVLAAR
ncbi:MAG: DoxX family protein [Candidatus Acidiferrales bacterium]